MTEEQQRQMAELRHHVQEARILVRQIKDGWLNKDENAAKMAVVSDQLDRIERDLA